MTISRFMVMLLATGFLSACGHPAHDVNDEWYSRSVTVSEKDFAWAAVRCGVPKEHWEVNEKLEVQRFSTLCMRHYGFFPRDEVYWTKGEDDALN